MTNNEKIPINRSLIVGDTSEVYHHRTLNILRNEGLNPFVTYEIEAMSEGVVCGINQIIDLQRMYFLKLIENYGHYKKAMKCYLI